MTDNGIMYNPEKQIDLILDNVRKLGDLAEWNESKQSFDYLKNSQDSTAVRTLLSDEFYKDEIKKHYELCNKLSSFIYQIYQQEPNPTKASNDNSKEFIDEIKSSFIDRVSPDENPVFFWKEEFWEFDSSNLRVRRESRKAFVENGYYYIKEYIVDKYTPEIAFQNTETIHAKHYLAPATQDEPYSYIYGKYKNKDAFTLRFYFNFKPDPKKIVSLLTLIQEKFDNAQVPFEFKFLSEPTKYSTHTDVAVLYVPRNFSIICFELVIDIYKNTSNDVFFVDSVPFFTYPIANGLSFGEDPDDRRFTSFGQMRAVFIAMAIVKNLDNLEVNKIISFLKRHGFVIDNFFCNPYTLRNYKKEIRFSKNVLKSNSKRYIQSNVPDNKYLKAAIYFANKICNEAIWQIDEYNDCNWIQFNGTQKSEDEDFEFNIFENLDDSFLNGRMGIAYFLYQLDNFFDDNTFYRTYYYILLSISRKSTINSEDSNLAFLQFKNRQIDGKDSVKTMRSKISNKNIDYNKIFNIKRTKKAWRNYKLDSVLVNDFNKDDKDIFGFADEIIENYVNKDRPFGSGFGNTETCFSITNGYAFLGYYFLRLYDQNNVPKLPINFEIIQDES